MAPSVLQQHLASTATLPQRLLFWQLSLAVGGLAVWAARGRAPGAARLAVAAPLLVLNQVLARLLFDGDAEVLSNISAFIVTCIANIKLLGWVMDRGSLVRPLLTLPQFVAVYALPITPADNQEPAGVGAGQGASGAKEGEEEAEDTQAKQKHLGGLTAETRSASTHFRHFLRKTAVQVVWWYVYVRYSAALPRIPLMLLQGFSQYLGLSASMDLLAAVVGAFTGLAVAPHFRNPYLSTSFADFWNRRWNLVVSYVLRSAVYDPIMEGQLVRRPGRAVPFSRPRRLAAVFAVFLLSGLQHEVLFWNFSGRCTPHLMWLSYFVLWGLLVIAESVGKKALRKAHIELPTWLGRIWTLAIFNALVVALWWPPLEELGVPDKVALHAVQTWQAVQKAVLGSSRA